ncbi:MAG: hypothetical protein JXP34_29220 [Planctomycetes bacterium]|nr:hypothetical protein [Planctomycetota bacterium]
MRTLRWIARIASIAILFAAPSCVELDGQRITIRYDGAKDELQILIHYDGIHDSGSPEHGDGRQQIPEFVKEGRIMLFDWFFVLKFDEIRRDAERTEMPPAQRAFADAILESVTRTPLGHFRDPDGRVGAVQLVMIRQAKEVVRKLNAAFREALLASRPAPEEEGRDAVMSSFFGGEGSIPGAVAGPLRAWAREGRDFFAIDGNSIEISFPMPLAIWAKAKATLLERLDWDKVRQDDERVLVILEQLFALTPISIRESSEAIRIRLGEPGRESTFRFRLRDAYNPDLEDVVIEHVPVRLDPLIAGRLLGKEADKASAAHLDALMAWGPEEERVAAVINRYARAPDGAEKEAARAWLTGWAKDWNRTRLFPEAPMEGDPAAFLAAWKGWYRRMLAFPADDLIGEGEAR